MTAHSSKPGTQLRILKEYKANMIWNCGNVVSSVCDLSPLLLITSYSLDIAQPSINLLPSIVKENSPFLIQEQTSAHLNSANEQPQKILETAYIWGVSAF